MVSTSVDSRAMRDREALVALYYGTGGADWRSNGNWLTEEPLRAVAWRHDRIARAGSRALSLGGEQPVGRDLPPELGNLGSLEAGVPGRQRVDRARSLRNSGALPDLDWLGLSGNKLTGAIPPQLGQSGQPRGARARSDNDLTGTIPPELGKLGSLQDLWLGENNLTGAIPPELGNLGRLAWLGLGDNKP